MMLRISSRLIILVLFLSTNAIVAVIGQEDSSLVLSENVIKEVEGYFKNGEYAKAKKQSILLLDQLVEKSNWTELYNALRRIYFCDYMLSESYQNSIELFDNYNQYESKFSKKDRAKFNTIHGYMMSLMGMNKEAVEKEAIAISILKELNDKKELIVSYERISNYLAYLNDFESGIKYAHETLSLLDDEQVERRVIALRNLTEYYYYARDLDLAIEYLEKARRIEKEESLETLFLVAKIALAKEDLVDCKTNLDKLRQKVESSLHSDITKLEKCQNALDSICISTQKARINTFEGLLQNVHSLYGQFYTNSDRLDLAESQYRKSLDLLKKGNDERSYAKELYNLADLQLKLGKETEGLESGHEVLRILSEDFDSESIYDIPSNEQIIPDVWVMEALYQKAKIFQSKKRKGELDTNKEALINESYDKAIYCLDVIRDNYIDDNSKYGLTEIMSALFNDAFQYNYSVYKDQISFSSLEKIFELSQLKKAFVFKSSISQRKAILQSGVPEALADEFFKIKSEVILNKGKISDKVDSLRRMEKTIAEQYPSSQRLFVSDPLKIDQVQSKLYSDQVMLHYTQTDSKNLYCLVIGDDYVDIVHQELPDDFFDMVRTYNKLLVENPSSQLSSSTNIKKSIDVFRRLYQYTIESIDKKLASDVKSLTIVPDGELHNITFDNLLFEDISSWKDPNTLEALLLSKYSFNYLYHTEQILTQSKKSKYAEKKSVVGYNYELSKDHASTSLRSELFKELTYVNDELASIAAIVGSEAVSNEQLKEDSLKKFLKTSDIFHFAGHAWSDTIIGNSYLVLQDQPVPVYDSLTYKEVVSLNLNNKLVTLSACRTNLGQSIGSEGILSLSRAFTESGVDATLGSSWDAPDKITKKILVLFYQNLQEGMNKAEALRQAKLVWLADESTTLERNPSYWTNWKLYGDISPLRFDNRWNKRFPYIAGILATIFIFLIFKMKKKSHI